MKVRVTFEVSDYTRRGIAQHWDGATTKDRKATREACAELIKALAEADLEVIAMDDDPRSRRVLLSGVPGIYDAEKPQS